METTPQGAPLKSGHLLSEFRCMESVKAKSMAICRGKTMDLDSNPTWLVVWNMTFIFSYIGNNTPIWLSYFSEGLKPPTSNKLLVFCDIEGLLLVIIHKPLTLHFVVFQWNNWDVHQISHPWNASFNETLQPNQGFWGGSNHIQLSWGGWIFPSRWSWEETRGGGGFNRGPKKGWILRKKNVLFFFIVFFFIGFTGKNDDNLGENLGFSLQFQELVVFLPQIGRAAWTNRYEEHVDLEIFSKIRVEHGWSIAWGLNQATQQQFIHHFWPWYRHDIIILLDIYVPLLYKLPEKIGN